MAVFNKFQDFSEQLARATHNFSQHAFKVMLTNTLPVATQNEKSSLVEVTANSGYPSGGLTTQISLSEVDGVASVSATQVTFTATEQEIGPFRYAVLYNSSATSPLGALIGWWDYGTSITLHESETLTVKFGNTSPGVVFTLS